MPTLPTNRSTSSSPAEHVADHNTLHEQHNDVIDHLAETQFMHGFVYDATEYETQAGANTKVSNHNDATATVHGIADTGSLAVILRWNGTDFVPTAAKAAAVHKTFIGPSDVDPAGVVGVTLNEDDLWVKRP